MNSLCQIVDSVIWCLHEFIICQIVDSVIALFRVDFTGRGELAERQVKLQKFLQCLWCIELSVHIYIYAISLEWHKSFVNLQQKLAQMLSRLTKIAEEFNVAVYMTNQGKRQPVWHKFLYAHLVSNYSCLGKAR